MSANGNAVDARKAKAALTHIIECGGVLAAVVGDGDKVFAVWDQDKHLFVSAEDDPTDGYEDSLTEEDIERVP